MLMQLQIPTMLLLLLLNITAVAVVSDAAVVVISVAEVEVIKYSKQWAKSLPQAVAINGHNSFSYWKERKMDK